MRITIVGATGLLGSALSREALERGHDVVAASRSGRVPEGADAAARIAVDVTTGAGLDEALAGADVVVHAANSQADAGPVLVDGLGRVAAAAESVGAFTVLPSIVGCDEAGGAYYRAKASQERVLVDRTEARLIVRIAQFHEFVAWMLGQAARRGVSPRGAIPLQPLAAHAAAGALLDRIERGASGDVLEIAGPERTTVGALSRAWARAEGRHLLPVRIPRLIAGAVGRGALCPEPGTGITTGPTFEAWLRDTSLARG